MSDTGLLEQLMDVAAVVCVLLASVLSVAAGIGLLRFPDALSRLHAATKPQIFGLLLIIAAIALDQRSFATLLALVPVFVFQSLTAPVAAHMVGRAAYRTGQLDTGTLVVDELGPAIERSDSL
ncbi:monovalent cation/H(+) antiporter subunit G [Leucobacter sp. wl10]|uniref:monovalent cation/H(+) antiporter subunit G n=1 Tax=Leucobacter sp. wl10 TaxID=2304677 RepID=UPI000E5C417D|nr:monovalent cation/H(+) antiporter subunit G [Leucobacter sp. wl10]RGE22556.1 monovalent cation/H(+) antiporter subunit G [Leucobacter sp. wl10]